MPPVYEIGGTYAHGVTIDGSAYGSPFTIDGTATIDTTDSIGVYAPLQATVINSGTVSAVLRGIKLKSGGTVDNSGTIAATDHTDFNGAAVGLGGGDNSLTNRSGGVISGGTDGYGVRSSRGATSNTISNYGSISGFYGVEVGTGAVSFTNQAGGTISGGNTGVFIYSATGSVTNDGLITGVNHGVVIEDNPSGFFNGASGTIVGGIVGVSVFGGNATLENAGTIGYGYGGGAAVYLYGGGGGGARLIIDAGAVFHGEVQASTDVGQSNIIELKNGGAGTIGGLGTEYVGFQTVAIDSGATWTVSDTFAGIDSATIQGFNAHDTLDITDKAFAAGDTATIDSSTHILSIDDGDGSLIGTVQFGAGLSDGGIFHVADDGHGHIAITETVDRITSALSAGAVGLLTPGLYSDPLTVTNTGAITGSGGGLVALTDWTIVNHGTIGVTGTGIYLAAGGSISNTGSIGGGGFGIRTGNGGGHLGTIDNSGTITGSVYYAVELNDGGSLTNEAGGYVNGFDFGVVGRGAASTIENAGTIKGGIQAIYMGAGTNRLIVDGGAVFSGAVVAQPTASNTLELSAKTGPGTITGIGTQFTGFQTITIDAGADWKIGTISGAAYVVNAGTIDNQGTGVAIVLADSGTINNSGTIIGLSASNGSGVDLRSGGSVANSGSISGTYNGIKVEGAPGSIDNSGTISASGGTGKGVLLGAGGDVTNETGGVITGGFDGVYLVAAGTVINHGSLGGGAGVELGDGGLVQNDGTIGGHDYGVYLDNGGSVSNAAGGTISATFGSAIKGTEAAGTIDNAGAITVGSTGYAGIDLEKGGSVVNHGTGSVTGYAFGIRIAGGAGTVDNSGTIQATGANTTGIYLGGNGSITNEAGGAIAGTTGGVVAGHRGHPFTVTVSNDGSIDGGSGFGVYMDGSVSLTNLAGGVITGGELGAFIIGDTATVTNAGSIGGGQAGIVLGTTSASLINSGTISGTYTGVQLNYGGGLTNAAGGTITGVYVTGGVGAIDNAGTISAAHNSVSDGMGGPPTLVATNGVGLYHGGTVLNEHSGSITGGTNGVFIGGDAMSSATVENAGTITGGTHAVYLNAATNRLIVDAGAVFNGNVVANATAANTLELSAAGGPGTISEIGAGASYQYQNFQTVKIDSGATWAIGQFQASVAIDNAGTVIGGFALALTAGGSVTNAAGGLISGTFNAVEIFTAAGTVDNFGTIAHLAVDGLNPGDVSNGVYLKAGGSVTNETGGSISGGYSGIDISGAAGTVDNSGTITGTITAGISLNAGGSVTNEAGGSIGGRYGVVIVTAAGTVDNSGTITGTGGAGISLTAGGSVTNEAGGSIGGKYGVDISGATGTVDNFGTITGAKNSVVYLGDGGSVTNAATGKISGGTIGVYINSTTGTVDNFGTITATDFTAIAGVDLRGGSVTNAAGGSISGRFEGVYISVAAGTLDNSGTISGTLYYGVNFRAGGSVTNETGASISGGNYGVIARGSTATVENAGTIAGGTDSLKLNATGTNRLIVDARAVFTGNVVANATAANTLELTSHAGAGTISGLGAKYTGFQTVTIDSGATWTVAGTEAGIGTTTIQGFTTHDRLDITDLTFASGDTVNINDTTDVLTILAADGSTVLDTVQLAGDFTGDFFHLADDGTHGSYITEDGTPCYCRGTMILTGNGEVAVEDLKIGDRLMTKSRALRRIKWIGTRSYNGRFVAGNRDLLPVLIRAGALADNVPRRNLWISPLHAMFIDGVLVPAYALINGTSIVQADAVDQFEYFHLELDSHDVIVAEGALSETFIDDDSRNMFHNVADYYALYPDAKRKPAEYCAPMVEHGPELEVIRRRISARADPVGWKSAA